LSAFRRPIAAAGYGVTIEAEAFIAARIHRSGTD
jgi:hypothetical protein